MEHRKAETHTGKPRCDADDDDLDMPDSAAMIANFKGLKRI